MLYKKIYDRLHTISSLWTKTAYLTFWSLLVFAILIPLPGNAEETNEETKTDSLPQSPDTGTPEQDFSAGGTRNNHFQNSVCGVNERQIFHLLGNNNREFTSSAYPTFWFHIPRSIAPETKIEFTLKELETNKDIYSQIVPLKAESAIKGIALPKEETNALSLNTNYVWSLSVSCPEIEQNSLLALSGWLSRLPVSPQLQNQLAATPKQQEYQVYWEHEFLYNALSELAYSRIAEPNSRQIETSWNQLLIELGWQDIVQKSDLAKPYIINTSFLLNNQNK